MINKKRPIDLRKWLIPKLRRISYQWPPRKDAKAKARIARGEYKCVHCEGIFGPKEIALDHVESVVPIENYNSLVNNLSKNTELLQLLQCDTQEFKELFHIFVFIARLFCKSSGFQVLCKEDHDSKTFLENQLRKEYKKSVKKFDKTDK